MKPNFAKYLNFINSFYVCFVHVKFNFKNNLIFKYCVIRKQFICRYSSGRNYDRTGDIETSPEPERRYPKRNRALQSNLNSDYDYATTTAKKSRKLNDKCEDDMNKMDFWYSWYAWSDCKLAEKYDKERNFYPQPGPSNLNYYEDEDLTGYYQPIKKSSTRTQTQSNAKKSAQNTQHQRQSLRKVKLQKDNIIKEKSPELNEPSALSEDTDWEDDILVQSFYEQSFVQNSQTPTARYPLLQNYTNTKLSSVTNRSNGQESDINWSPNEKDSKTTPSTPLLAKLMENFKKSSSETKILKRRKPNGLCTIKPIENSSCPNDIERALESHKIPKMIHKVPYYSDSNDIVANNSKKEIGLTVLQLTGDAVNNCDQFSSELNVMSMNQWQKVIALQSKRGSQRIHDNKHVDDSNSVRKLLASNKANIISIKPAEQPPSNESVTKWLNIRAKTSQKKRTSERLQTNNEYVNIDASPIKFVQEKMTTALNHSDKNDDDDVVEVFTTPRDELLAKLHSRSDLSISIVSNHTKSQNTNGYDDENDVICLDDASPAKSQNLNSFTKLVRWTK